jgi:hypothetical protein
MTTTVPTKGGPAQAVRQDMSGLNLGGPALRVYGFASAADAAAAGYAGESAPAMSIYLVSDAQLASGQFYLEGDPATTAIYTAPVGTPTEGSYTQPVYLVGGSL